MTTMTSTNTETQIHGVLADYGSADQLMAAIKEARQRGYTKFEAYTPFPIHGIDEAMGATRSPLGWLVMAGGLVGGSIALWLQWWTGAVAYPLVIAGKPLFSIEPSIPITFELTVLVASFCAVFGMFTLNGLPQFYHPVFNYRKWKGATDDRFLFVIEARDRKFKAADDWSWLGTEVEMVEE
jgi:hypothetical protein